MKFGPSYNITAQQYDSMPAWQKFLYHMSQAAEVHTPGVVQPGCEVKNTIASTIGKYITG